MDKLAKLPSVMKQNQPKNGETAQVGLRFWHGHDFPIPAAQIERHRAGRKPAEIEAGQVTALVRGKNQPVGRSIAHGASRPRPVIDRQSKTSRSKTREGNNAHCAGSKIEMRTRRGQVERAEADRVDAAFAETTPGKGAAGQRE